MNDRWMDMVHQSLNRRHLEFMRAERHGMIQGTIHCRKCDSRQHSGFMVRLSEYTSQETYCRDCFFETYREMERARHDYATANSVADVERLNEFCHIIWQKMTGEDRLPVSESLAFVI